MAEADHSDNTREISNEAIDAALDALTKACGFTGESGTEAMFLVLREAVDRVEDDWHIVIKSHEDGLCYNVNALLSRAIVKTLST